MVLRRVGEVAALIVLTFMLAGLGNATPAPPGSPAESAAEPRKWPCRIIVHRPLLQVVEAAWEGSRTFRRLCGALAEKGAIAILRPGAETSQFAAQTRLSVTEDGVAVGRVMVPLNTETLQYIAHELEHILELAEGLDLSRESERNGSGVWRTVDGFETQRAIDTGRQVAREVAEGLGGPRRMPKRAQRGVSP
jgi:hypothetical protein